VARNGGVVVVTIAEQEHVDDAPTPAEAVVPEPRTEPAVRGTRPATVEDVTNKDPRTTSAEVEIKEGTWRTFTFCSIGSRAFDELKRAHPPTEPQREALREELVAVGADPGSVRLEWNSATFPPALVAAASHDPKLNEQDAHYIFNASKTWNEAEHLSLFIAALDAQRTRAIRS
jgi:hypothetical protein